MEIMHSQDFRQHFTFQSLNTAKERVRFLEWIPRQQDGPAAQILERIKQRLAAKTIDPTDEEVMKRLQSNQFRQFTGSALSMHIYSEKDPRIRQQFKLTFQERGASIAFVNEGGFVQRLITRKPGVTMVDQPPSTLAVMMWMHCISIVDEEMEEGRIAPSRNRLSGNKIGFVCQEVTSAWRMVAEKVGAGNLSSLVAPFLWFDRKAARFRCLQKDEGFTHKANSTSLIPAHEPELTGDNANKPDLPDAKIEAYRELTYYMLRKLKQIVCRNEIYVLDVEKIRDCPDVKALRMKPGCQLPEVFNEVDQQTMDNLGIQRDWLSPLLVTNVENNKVEAIRRHPKAPPKYKDRTIIFTAHNKRKLRRFVASQPDPKRRRIMGQSSTNIANELKEEVDVIDINVPAVAHLDESGKEAYDVLCDELRKYVHVYTCPFSDILTVHEDTTAMDISQSIAAVITDPPYGIRQQNLPTRNDVSYDELSTSEMAAFVRLLETVLTTGGHGHIFCSFDQFPQWKQLLRAVSRVEQDHDDENPAKTIRKRIRTFKVEKVPLQYVNSYGNYNRNPNLPSLTHMSMTQSAVHFWSAGLPYDQSLKTIDYSDKGFVQSSLPPTSNTTDNIPKLTGQEVVYKTDPDNPGPRQRLRAEQKGIDQMKMIVSKFCPAGETVLDPFAGTYSTAKACLSLNKHRRCIVSDSDPDCMKHGLPQLVEVFATQILNDLSDIVPEDPVITEAANTYLNQMAGVRVHTLNRDIWGRVNNLPPLQLLPEHIISFMCAMYKNYDCFNEYQRITPLRWSPRWRNLFNQIPANVLLSSELVRLHLQVRRSTLPNAGNGLFTTKLIQKNEIIGNFYGSLAYENLSKFKDAIFGEGLLAIEGSNFNDLAIRTSLKTKPTPSSVMRDPLPVYIYPAPFCAMRYINDARIRTEGTVPSSSSTAPRPGMDRVNCEFVDTCPNPTNAQLVDYTNVQVVATKTIPAGSELLLYYGDGYFGQGDDSSDDDIQTVPVTMKQTSIASAQSLDNLNIQPDTSSGSEDDSDSGSSSGSDGSDSSTEEENDAK